MPARKRGKRTRRTWVVGAAAGVVTAMGATAVTGSPLAGATTGQSGSSPNRGHAPSGAGGQLPGMAPPAGKVTAVGSGTVTVRTPRGSTLTVDVSSSTTYTKDGSGSSFSAVAVGEYVIVQPQRGSSPPSSKRSTVTAAAVHIVPSLPAAPSTGNGPVGAPGSPGRSAPPGGPNPPAAS